MDSIVNLISSLKEQQVTLQRLLEMKVWISDGPKHTREEASAQIAQIKALLEELDQLITHPPSAPQ